MARGQVFSIPPHAPFLPTLAHAILGGTLFPDWPREGAFWLSDITIFLPTRRARTALAEAFVSAFGDTPLLLPDIKALGGEDPEAEPFLPPYETSPPPPAISVVKRRLLLAQLVERWLGTRSDHPFSAPGRGGHQGTPGSAEMLALADSLATLIDDFTIARRDTGALDAIEDAQLPAQWQDNLAFVRFVLEHWPAILAGEGEIETAARSNLLLERQAMAVAALYGARPVIVAGSTGSIPATADLIAAIARLPRGAVVLPGLDTRLSSETTADLLDERNAPHGHPQYGLTKLLRLLGRLPETVTELAPPSPRSTALHAALTLADDTARWPEVARTLGAEGLAAATEGVSLCMARTAEEEARAVALAARAALDRGDTVAIISPDRTLARRIAAELRRFSVETDDAAGTPLVHARAGRLARQVVALLVGGLSPVDLMALLRNRHVTLGLGRAAVSLAADWLDFGTLRGQRPAPGFAGLKAGVAANLEQRMSHPALRLAQEQGAAVVALLEALDVALAPLVDLFSGPAFPASALAGALARTLDAVRATPPGETAAPLEGEDQLARWAEQLGEQSEHGPRFSARDAALALDSLMAGRSVRPRRIAAGDISILGRLEARLMRADTTILCGLVEGVWPEVADPGPWMSRGMRIGAGLEPPEKLHGLAAHDFLMAAGAPRLVLTWAERAGTGPATPSRLVQRLKAFLGEEITEQLHRRGAVWLDEARALDLAPGAPQPAARPAPRPPRAKRPRRLSVTDAELLLRSPYDLYAKYVLKLRPVAALGADPDAAERGTIIHDIFGDFIRTGNEPLAPDAFATLMRLAETRFSGLEAIPERRDIWLRRFARAAQLFLDFERERDATVSARAAEIDGLWSFEIGGEAFSLRGRADRIDRLISGRYEIIDFKTGSLPPAADMKRHFAPQMPLEAMMVRHGAFTSIAAGETDALTYIKIANGPEAFIPSGFALDKDTTLTDAIEAVFMRFQRQVEALLLSEDTPLAARVFPPPNQRFRGAYDHLARSDEWTLVDGGGEDE